MATFVTSDIHGCRKTFKRLLNTIKFSREDQLIVIGDLIDRGPDSRGVVTDILALKEEGFDVLCLRGNHEDFLLKAHADRSLYECWIYPQNGGDKTLKQYGWNPTRTPTMYERDWDRPDSIDYLKVIPIEHLRFFQSLPIVYEKDNFVFVHGGLDFWKDDPLKDTSTQSKLWSRGTKFKGEKLQGRTLITGHTPQTIPAINAMILFAKQTEEKHIIIDGGCVFDDHGYGHLACLRLEDLDVTYVENCE